VIGRRAFVRLGAGALFAGPTVGTSLAQTRFPNRPIRIFCPFAAGGYVDIVSRLVAEPMSKRLGVPVVVDNKPGATGLIAYNATAEAAPDGYTLTVISGATATSFAVMRRENDINRKFRMIGNIWESANFIVVHPDTLINNMKDMVDFARASPAASYTSGGMGTQAHLHLAAIFHKEGIRIEHVAYRGAVPALQDVVAGVVPIMQADTGSAMALLQAGKIRPIAVSTEKRSPLFPNVATYAEQGHPEPKIKTFGGLAVPKGTPDDAIEVLVDALNHALETQAVIDRINGMMNAVVKYSPQRMAQELDEAYATWLRIATDNNIKVE
jgi:tripartite-type tricarboxylate transporter receptor subunit TctC